MYESNRSQAEADAAEAHAKQQTNKQTLNIIAIDMMENDRSDL